MKRANQHFVCKGCEQSFGINKIPRLLPSCGHSMCQSCIKAFMEENQNSKIILKCIVDAQVMEFDDRQLSNFPKNFAMLKTIQKRQKAQQLKAQQLATLDNQKKQQEKQEKKIEQQKTDVIAQSPSQEQNILQEPLKHADQQPQKIEQNNICDKQQQNMLKQEQMCLIHSRPLQIVCLKDSVMICSNCALFGEHRNHTFKSLVDIKKDITVKQQQFLLVIDQKLQMQVSFNQALDAKAIDKLLMDKKQILTKQIQDHFDKLLKKLRQQQKKLYLRMQQIIEGMEKGFINDAEKAKNKLGQFSQWQKSALDFINILQGQDFQAKITILNYETSRSRADPIEEGYKIIDQAEKYKQQIVSHWNNLLKRFQVDLKAQEAQRLVNLIVIDAPKDEQQEEHIFKQLISIKNKSMQIKPFQHNYDTLPISKSGVLNHNTVGNDDLLIQMENHFYNHNIYLSSDGDTSLNVDYNLGELPDISKIQQRDSSFYHVNSFDYKHSPPTVPKSPSSVSTKPKGFEGKKKLKPVKVPLKYQKTMQSLISDTLDVLDFTNSQLGNQDFISILQHLKNKKVKTVKLIRCKLNDDILPELWNSMGRVLSLNLSQNLFSDRVIDSFLDNINKVPHLKTLTLSQNKINQRTVKLRIDEAKKQDVTITL